MFWIFNEQQLLLEASLEEPRPNKFFVVVVAVAFQKGMKKLRVMKALRQSKCMAFASAEASSHMTLLSYL